MEKPTVEQMQKYFGFDKIKPIQVSPGMQKEIDDDGDYFDKWYEESLRELYNQAMIEKKYLTRDNQ